MGNARNQHLAAALFVLQLLHRAFQPLCHFIKILADGCKFVLPVIINLEIQVPVPQLVSPLGQNIQRLLNSAEYDFC